MPFPADRVDIIVEAAFGADAAVSPLLWEWVDLSDRLDVGRQEIRVSRGRRDETSDAPPATMAVTLSNLDGWLTPNHPASPWWPDVDTGTPIRLWAEGAVPAAVLRAPGDMVTTPDHADFDVTGPLDLRAYIEPDQWANPSTPGDSEAGRAPLIRRWDDTERSWIWSLQSLGRTGLWWSEDGTAGIAGPIDSAIWAADRPTWVGVVIDPDNGADGVDITRYIWHGPGDPPADITTWDTFGTATRAGASSFHAGTSSVALGGPWTTGDDLMFRGRFLAAEIRDGVNGTIIADPDFTDPADIGAATVTDSTGKVWTLQGGAEITTRRVKFAGTIDGIYPTWPYGDNNSAGSTPSESRVHIDCAGPMRRLDQGAKPIRSTLYRGVIASQNIGSILAYWPCEEGPAAARFGSGISGGAAATVSGAKTGADATLPAAAPLPTVEAGDTVDWVGTVPVAGAPTDRWTVDLVYRLPEGDPDPGTPVFRLTTTGTASTWTLSASSTGHRLNVTDAEGDPLVAASSGGAILDDWVLFRLEAAQTGGTITWKWTAIRIATGAVGSATGSFTGTLGAIATVGNNAVGPAGGMSFGHVIVSDGTRAIGWLAGVDTAWVGESAAHRVSRLCREERIPVEIIGDPTITAFFRGSLAWSEPMGPQGQQPLLTLLRECAAVDLGILSERRALPGIVYRARRTLENQTPAIELTAASDGQIVNPFEPIADDQRIRNDVTVSAAAGSSARLVDQAHADRRGLYDADVTINGVGGVAIQATVLAFQGGLLSAVGDQNVHQASWRLVLGTQPGMRYPSIRSNLATAPEVLEAWQTIALGDRITVSDLPAQHPSATIELIVEAVSDMISPTSWAIEATCSPGGPWLVGVLDE